MSSPPASSPFLAWLFRWGPAIVYGGIILGLSSIPATKIPSQIFVVSDKFLHAILYAGGAITLRHAVRNSISAWWLMVFFAYIDENYQRLTPGRDASTLDWCADAVGAAIGITLYLVYERYFTRRGRRPTP